MKYVEGLLRTGRAAWWGAALGTALAALGARPVDTLPAAQARAQPTPADAVLLAARNPRRAYAGVTP